MLEGPGQTCAPFPRSGVPHSDRPDCAVSLDKDMLKSVIAKNGLSSQG